MVESTERDTRGRWLPGQSANPATKWGPDNPPPKSPGRPKRDAWVTELEERLEDPYDQMYRQYDEQMQMMMNPYMAPAMGNMPDPLAPPRVGGPILPGPGM